MDILKDLNLQQKKAVTHTKGPLLVIAGAGTGKTKVITKRIAWLIEQKKAKPSEILALTFTDKAAGEMEERVDVLVPYGYTDMWISTFHAFGDRILREHAIDLGLPTDFEILTRPGQAVFIRDRIFQFDLNHYRPLGNPTSYIEALIKLFSRIKDEDINPSEFIKYAQKRLQNVKTKEEKKEAEKELELAKAFVQYQEMMEQDGKLDFGDQVVKTLGLFRNHPKMLSEYQDKFKYILVDEFQDTNYAQNELVKILASRDKNITVVGDDDQSVYRFRGAAISNILDFKKNFSDCKQIVLMKNYRSTQQILDSAYKLIRHNDPDRLEVKNKIDKKLKSIKSDGPLPFYLHFQTSSEEADKTAEIIKEKKEKEGYKYKDFAILVRANGHAQPFAQSLGAFGIPYKFSGSSGLYSREEVRILISFLRCLADYGDNLSLYHLAISDIYSIDPTQLTILTSFVKRRNWHLRDAFSKINEISEFENITSENKDKIKKISDDLDKFNKISKKDTVGQVLYQFLQHSGYLKKMVKEESIASEVKIQNIGEFFEKITKDERSSFDRSVMKFTEHLDTMIAAGEDPSVSEIDPDLDAVNLLTVHSAKGLEFEVVFLVNLISTRFPSRRRSEPLALPDDLIKETLPEDDYHIQEERRLFYVGMTRAKKELYFTCADDYGGKRKARVSQFVLEVLDKAKMDVEKFKSHPLQKIKKFEKTEIIELPKSFYNGQGKLRLNPHQIDYYISCPLKFKNAHILKVPFLRHHSAIYGSAIHKAIGEYFLRKIRGKKITLDDVIAVFEKAWISEGFIAKKHEEKRLKAGRKALEKFYKRQEKEKRLPSKIEERFNFSLDDVKISGRFDCVYEDSDTKHATSDKEIEIRDFKTSDISEQKKADSSVKNSRQMDIYALAWKELTGKIPGIVSLYFIESEIIGKIEKTEKNLQETKKEIEKVAKGIKNKDFKADPAYRQCEFCPYSDKCSYTQAKK